LTELEAPADNDSLRKVRAMITNYRYWLSFCAVAGAYVGTAKIGIHLSVAHGVITPVWPPAGIALAALVLGGLRLWPAVALGAFVSNATTGAAVDVAVVIAAGNTLEALAGAYLLRRFRFRAALDRVRDVVLFVLLAPIASTTLAATTGVTALWVAGAPAASPYGPAWRLWWLGDAMGVMLVAPLILVAATNLPVRIDRRRLLEAVALFVIVAGISSGVFLGGLWRYPYLLFPALILATFRFKQIGATAASFVAATFAVAGVVVGDTPIGPDSTSGVQILQSMIALVAVSLLILAATLSERDEATAALARTHEGLSEAQSLAQLGSWEWDLSSNDVTWSPELVRIYGLDRGASLNYEAFLSLIHPDDRELGRATVDQALADSSSFEFVHRIVRPGGEERTVHARGRVIVDSRGQATRMVGTAQDITDRLQLERVRDSVLATVSHEVRTPLTSIVGFALTLKERGNQLDPEERRQILAHLTDQALKLQRLLAELLDFERFRQGHIHLDFNRSISAGSSRRRRRRYRSRAACSSSTATRSKRTSMEAASSASSRTWSETRSSTRPRARGLLSVPTGTVAPGR
jgi:PAS domain S-box-containing protein